MTDYKRKVGPLVCYEANLTSSAGGAATKIWDGLSGVLVETEYVPGAGCTADWDLTIPVTNGVADALGGNGADLSESTDGGKITTQKYFCGDTITVTVANLGDTKTVRIRLFVWTERLA